MQCIMMQPCSHHVAYTTCTAFAAIEAIFDRSIGACIVWEQIEVHGIILQVQITNTTSKVSCKTVILVFWARVDLSQVVEVLLLVPCSITVNRGLLKVRILSSRRAPLDGMQSAVFCCDYDKLAQPKLLCKRTFIRQTSSNAGRPRASPSVDLDGPFYANGASRGSCVNMRQTAV